MKANTQTSGTELELLTQLVTHSSMLPASISTASSDCLVLSFADVITWNNHEDAVSAETERLLDLLKAALVAPVFCLIGSSTNCLSLAVFYRQGLKERTNLCLFVLSLFDLLYLTVIAVAYGKRFFAFSAEKPRIGPVFHFCIENHIFGLYGISHASRLVQTVVASDRCFCTYHPLRSNTLLNTKTMAIFLMTSSLLITFLYYVIAEEYNVCVVDVVRNTSFLQISTSTDYYLQNKSLVDVLEIVVYGSFLPAMFNSVITGSAIAMIVKLRKVVAWRQESSTAISKKEILLTKMLIVLSTQFAIVSMPNVVFSMKSEFVPEFSQIRKYYNINYLLFSLFEMTSLINASIHFFVYFFVGSKYRSTLRSLFWKGSRKYLRTSEESER